MATLTEDAEALCSIARKTGKTLMTPYELNHSHYMESAANQVAMGSIGTIQQVALHMSSVLIDLFGGEPWQKQKSTCTDLIHRHGQIQIVQRVMEGVSSHILS